MHSPTITHRAPLTAESNNMIIEATTPTEAITKFAIEFISTLKQNRTPLITDSSHNTELAICANNSVHNNDSHCPKAIAMASTLGGGGWLMFFGIISNIILYYLLWTTFPVSNTHNMSHIETTQVR